MTALSAVRDAWDEVLLSSAVQDYTTNLYNYDIQPTSNKSVANSALMMLKNELNFAQFVFSKDNEFLMCKELLETFDVIISYYKEIDLNGNNYHAVTDFFDTVFSVVRSEIGTTWSSTVDYYNLNKLSLGSTELDGRACWSGTVTYTGKKTNDLT